MNHDLTDPAFVPSAVAARRLGVPMAWLREEAERGRVPSIRCGRQLVFDVGAVAECLRQRAVLTAPTVDGEAHG